MNDILDASVTSSVMIILIFRFGKKALHFSDQIEGQSTVHQLMYAELKILLFRFDKKLISVIL